MRRLLFAAVILYVPVLSCQIFGIFLLSAFVIWHLATYKPFEENFSLQIINELFFIAITDMTIVNSEYAPISGRITFGWVWIATYLLLFLINIVVLVK